MSMMDKAKEKAARTPVIGVAGEQPSFMYNKTIIADSEESGNLQATEEATLFERIGGQYEERAGIFYPLISIEEENVDVGKYGHLWMVYMKLEYPQRYLSLKRCCRLREKAAEINEEAYKLLDNITDRYLQSHKPKNPTSTMEMWRIREQAKMMAEEIILAEIVNQFH
jgi:hypothetical protein